MKRYAGLLTVAATIFLLGFATRAPAQNRGTGRVIVPNSSVEKIGDVSLRAHTTFLIYQSSVKSQSQPTGETPASLACVYNLVTLTPGCPKVGSSPNPSGGAGAIALVDAYDNPDATIDISTYSTQWGLPPANFTQAYANGHQPPNNPGGWSLEEALDIEMAHAMAPNAKIFLVEAASNSFSDLFQAEGVASTMVAANGGGEVSDSWQGSEFSGETADDSNFTTLGVVYFASSGDSGGVVGYPSVSPDVVSAGGTTINRDVNGNFTSESAWNSAGGGPSVYESRPGYQNFIQRIVGSKRGTPDFSFDANPSTGPATYDADGGYGWIVVGGTSVSSPALAGIVNTAGHFYTSSNTELVTVYQAYAKAVLTGFRDITSGSNGYSCVKGWDYCTGIGSGLTYKGK